MNTIQRQFSNFQHQQQLLYVALFTMAAVMVWIVVSLLSSQHSTGISAELQKLALPLEPNIKESVIGRLETKRKFQASELQQFPIYKVIKSQDGKNERLVTIETPDETLEGGTPGVTTGGQGPGAITGANPAPFNQPESATGAGQLEQPSAGTEAGVLR